MAKITPRPYQIDIPKLLKKEFNNHDKFLIELPTGAGKTFTFAKITEELIDKRFAMLVPRINLAHQTKAYASEWGIIQGNHARNEFNRAVIFTGRTFLNRTKSLQVSIKDFDVIVIDEAHIGSDGFKGVIEEAEECGVKVIFMTATPYDAKGRELDQFKGAFPLVEEKWRDINTFIEHNFLTKLVYKVVGSVDESLLKMGKDDYTRNSIAEAMEDAQIDEVGTILRDRVGSTLILAFDTKHADSITEDLQLRGESVAILHSKKNDKGVLKRFERGEIDFLVSVGMITTGTDLPIAQTLAICRPIGSQTLYRQAVGRVLRLHKNKDFALVLDLYNVISLCSGHPLLPPPPHEPSTKSKSTSKCSECGETVTRFIKEITEEAGVQVITKTCPYCDHSEEDVKMLHYETCDKCNHSSKVDLIYSFMGNAVTNCSFCDNRIVIAPLAPKELVITFQNRDKAVEDIKALIKDRFRDEEEFLNSFSSNFSRWEFDASLTDLSVMMGYLTDFKGKYSRNSFDKINSRIASIEPVKNDKLSLFLKKEKQYELLDRIDKLSDGVDPYPRCRSGILATIKRQLEKGKEISDTKAIIRETKKYITWLKKNVET